MKTFYWKKKWKMTVILSIVLLVVAVGYVLYFKKNMGNQWIHTAENSHTGEVQNENILSMPAAMIAVHVSGAVKEPERVFYLPDGARMIDAIKAAGGETEQADLSQLNLASILKDGQKIRVPKIGENMISTEQGTNNENPENYLTNINLATTIELDSLPGIGETFAKRIVEYREQNGDFQTIEDIMKVKGIGENLFEDIKDLITV